MKNLLILLFLTIISCTTLFASYENPKKLKQRKYRNNDTIQIFNKLRLKSNSELDISYDAFRESYGYYKQIKLRDQSLKNILIIVDYSKTINEKRFYVINLNDTTLVYKTYVSHALRSGKEYPIYFSNIVNSKRSPIGAFFVNETYQSKKVGFALRLDGLETYNDNSRKRGIVIHASSAKKFVCHSEGCFTLPKNVFREIINYIKNGTFMFVYH